jgi:HK97 gp10 family phage protein
LTGGEAYVGVSWQGNAFYGRFLEFGTAKMAARPFLRPAFDARSGEALGIFMDRLRENIERARRRAAAKTQGTA